MRLLNVDTLELFDFTAHGMPIPPYVTASHRWALGSETTFKDVLKRRNTEKPGYQKVKAFAEYIRTSIPTIKWLWIDTCCIDQKSTAELSESINSMFDYYRASALCLAYLGDVEDAGLDNAAVEALLKNPKDQAVRNQTELAQSSWFTRGWTLQELLAPDVVVFLTKTGQVIGHTGDTDFATFWKTSGGGKTIAIGPCLNLPVEAITGVPSPVLESYVLTWELTPQEMISWMDGRVTSRAEDIFYALYGLLGVSAGANYGEGYMGAKRRFLKAIEENRAFEKQEKREVIKRMMATESSQTKDKRPLEARLPAKERLSDRAGPSRISEQV